MEMMIDIETLDVKPSAVVLSIGAVVFHPNGHVMDRWYRVLQVQEQLDRGRTVSFDTITWWMSQDGDARNEAFAPVRQMVAETLSDLLAFCRTYDANAYWALGPQFDYIILENLFNELNREVPWGYGQLRDVRTICNETKIDRRNPGSQVLGIPHTPIYDCEYQIELLTMARGRINKKSS